MWPTSTSTSRICAVIIVGDRSKIETDLRALPIGKNLDVVQFDDDFRLVPAK